jgi:hypothetical protein
MAHGILGWHNAMRDKAREYTGGKCQDCRQESGRGVIHHLSYPKDWQRYDVLDLISFGVCIFICEDCHKARHKNNAMKPCDNCGADTLHGEIRADQLFLTGYSLCHDCFEIIRKGEPNNLIKITKLSGVPT